MSNGLAFLLLLLGYCIEVMGVYTMHYGDLFAIWTVSLGIAFSFLSIAIVNEAQND